MVETIYKYFKGISPQQLEQFQQLYNIYFEWNQKINVVSRKDFDNFYIHHVLHSLSIAKFIQFKNGTLVMDLGTGGGFPAIPLAILYPEVKFLAVDSIQKKLTVVNEAITALNLTNIQTYWGRAESVTKQFDFVITRAVAPFSDLIRWSKGRIHPISFNQLDNGLIALKGGDLAQEIKDCNKRVKLKPISDYFNEDFFETKFVTYVKI